MLRLSGLRRLKVRVLVDGGGGPCGVGSRTLGGMTSDGCQLIRNNLSASYRTGGQVRRRWAVLRVRVFVLPSTFSNWRMSPGDGKGA